MIDARIEAAAKAMLKAKDIYIEADWISDDPWKAYTAFVTAALKAADAVLWQPIESAPKDGTPIIAFSKSEADEPVVVAWYGTRWLARWDGFSVYDEAERGKFITSPTHWQPIPTPPQEQKED